MKSKLFPLAFCLIIACKNDSSHDEHAHHQHSMKNEIEVDNTDYSVFKDTRHLVKLAFEKIDPMKVMFMNTKRAEIYKKLMETTTGQEKLQNMANYAFELVNKGETELAIKTYKELLKNLDDNVATLDKANVNKLKSLLGISYLRLGEQQNCLANHNHQSCFVPIQKDGLHTVKEGSENAIEIFSEILDDNPNDKNAKYLINIAYMTLGFDLNNIPKKHRIHPNAFKSEEEIPRYEEIAGKLGLDFNKLSGSTVIDDFNNDGNLDVIATSWGYSDNIVFYKNNGDGSFTDVTKEAGLQGFKGGLNMNHTDFDNDGNLDIYITRGAWFADYGKIPSTLLRNKGDGTFEDVTLKAGLTKYNPRITSAWADLNLDGWLDLVIPNETSSDMIDGLEIWMNNKNGTFTDVAPLVQLNIRRLFKGITIADMNNDRWPDIFLSNYNGKNILMINAGEKEASKLRFFNAGETAKVLEPAHSFPTFFIDVDNNGWEDIFIGGYDPSTFPTEDYVDFFEGKIYTERSNRLYLNNGNNTFTDGTNAFGLQGTFYAMGCNQGDINVDGYPDIYLGTGNPSLYSIIPNKMYLNKSGKKFVDVSFSGGFANIQKGHGVSFADLDNDGDEDIYEVMGGAFEGDVFPNTLFENPNYDQNNWITLKLEGVSANRAAIGARVMIVGEENGVEKRFYQKVHPGSSFGNNSLRLECGLGKCTKIKALSILWPSLDMSVDDFTDVAINTHYAVKQGAKKMNVLDLKKFKLGK